MEPVAEESEDAGVAADPAIVAASAAIGKQPAKLGAGNFRVNMNVIVRVRPLQVITLAESRGVLNSLRWIFSLKYLFGESSFHAPLTHSLRSRAPLRSFVRSLAPELMGKKFMSPNPN